MNSIEPLCQVVDSVGGDFDFQHGVLPIAAVDELFESLEPLVGLAQLRFRDEPLDLRDDVAL